MNLLFIEYNRANKDYARSNRKSMTPSEKIIREQVLRKKKTGYLFLRQKTIGPFIADFYCSKLLLAIEIDGNSHEDKEDYDARRTGIINNHGIVVIRYANNQVNNNIDFIRKDLMKEIADRKETLKL